MALNLPPDLIAELDQVAAAWDEALDPMVDYVRDALAVADPAIVVQVIRRHLVRGAVDRERMAGAFATALVRLGRQPAAES